MACVPVLSHWLVAVEIMHTACQESNRRERFARGEPTMLAHFTAFYRTSRLLTPAPTAAQLNRPSVASAAADDAFLC